MSLPVALPPSRGGLFLCWLSGLTKACEVLSNLTPDQRPSLPAGTQPSYHNFVRAVRICYAARMATEAHPKPHKNARSIAGSIKISVRLSPEIHEAASCAAGGQNMYLMDWVRRLIEAELKRTKRTA